MAHWDRSPHRAPPTHCFGVLVIRRIAECGLRSAPRRGGAISELGAAAAARRQLPAGRPSGGGFDFTARARYAAQTPRALFAAVVLRAAEEENQDVAAAMRARQVHVDNECIVRRRGARTRKKPAGIARYAIDSDSTVDSGRTWTRATNGRRGRVWLLVGRVAEEILRSEAEGGAVVLGKRLFSGNVRVV